MVFTLSFAFWFLRSGFNEFVFRSFQKRKAPGIAKKLRGSKKSIRVEFSVAYIPRKTGRNPGD